LLCFERRALLLRRGIFEAFGQENEQSAVEDPDAIRAILAALTVSRERADRAPPFAASLDTSLAATISA
jgi:hypothetical protein